MTSHSAPSEARWAQLPESAAIMLAAPAYFCVYLAYLFWHRESEVGHWLSLVILPVLLVWALHRASGGTLRGALASLGLGKVRWTRGLVAALLMGVILGIFQVMASRSGEMAMDAFRTGRAAWLLPVAFVFMLLTAGFTEELFFRGFLQTRLEGLLRSRVAGLLLASFCFGVYHLPYAYFNPRWPSAGDWGQAWAAALGQGIPAGLILGALYLYSGRNLLAPAVLHALVDAFPAMGILHFGSG